MTISSRSRVRSLSLAVMCLVVACDDEDSCGAQSLQLEVTPSQACLELSVNVTQAGSYEIVGTNGCADPLVVQAPGTHDGGASTTFPAGGPVSITLEDSEVFNQDGTVKTWVRYAALGSEAITISMTKPLCD